MEGTFPRPCSAKNGLRKYRVTVGITATGSCLSTANRWCKKPSQLITAPYQLVVNEQNWYQPCPPTETNFLPPFFGKGGNACQLQQAVRVQCGPELLSAGGLMQTWEVFQCCSWKLLAVLCLPVPLCSGGSAGNPHRLHITAAVCPCPWTCCLPLLGMNTREAQSVNLLGFFSWGQV